MISACRKKSQSAPPARKNAPHAPYNSPPPLPPNGVNLELHATVVSTATFVLREDGSIQVTEPAAKHSRSTPEFTAAESTPLPPSPPRLIYRNDDRGLWLYHGNSLELLDAIAAKYPEGPFDAIFADPPYFLSNGGITCHAGKMVKVDKGDWDKSRGPELNHEFNLEWLRRCQRVLKPNGTIWVSGTHHVIFSIGYAMQQLGYKILNDTAIKSFQTVLKLKPADLAGIHYRLARLFHKKESPEARRHILLALEEAPRFRAAHQLLLELTPN